MPRSAALARRVLDAIRSWRAIPFGHAQPRIAGATCD